MFVLSPFPGRADSASQNKRAGGGKLLLEKNRKKIKNCTLSLDLPVTGTPILTIANVNKAKK